MGGDGEIIKNPGADSVFKSGAWVYLGMNPHESTIDDVQGLEKLLSSDIEHFRSTKRRGTLLRFIMEFDCFEFPENTPENISLRDLNLRHTLGLNLAGIVKVNAG